MTLCTDLLANLRPRTPEILQLTAELVAVESGSYDEWGHSPLYGYGRPDPVRAQQLAKRRTRRRATPIG